MATLINVRGAKARSASDLAVLISAANWIGINPDWLALVEGFESGLNPASVNAQSGASGVIQFLPITALKLMGMKDTPANRQAAINRVRKMSFSAQHELVKKYFAPYRGKLKSLDDVYLAVFYPAAIGTASDHVIATAGSKVYEQNKGFDKAAKGYITKADITGTIHSIYQAAINNPRITVAAGLGTTVALGASAFGLYRLFTNKGKLA